MHALAALLFFFGLPFWESKPPEKWTDREIDTVRHASPWVEPVGPNPSVLIYLATAAPIELAEAQLRLRARNALREPDPDYVDYLRENRENVFVLAIPYETLHSLGDAEQTNRLENESEMQIARKSYNILGYFPPTPSDPVLRLAFPRAVKPTDKAVSFQLFLPGLPFPEREVEFRIKDLTFHGKLEM